MVNGKFFSLKNNTVNGLSPLCKYHETIGQLKYRNEKYKSRVLTMDLTRQQFFNILKTPCYYCGATENIGVDRVFNEQTYAIDNCVSCCSDCNMLKGRLDGDVFLNLIQRIQNHQDKMNQAFEDFEDDFEPDDV